MSRVSGFTQLGFVCVLMCGTVIAPALVHAADQAPQVPPLQVPVDQLDGIEAHVASIREEADLERNSTAPLESEAHTFRDSSSVIST